jgi:GNAT superfamily N-acetyltransferase
MVELYRDAFGSQKLVEFIVVKMKGEVIGFASFFYLYSTWEGRSIFTDDVIVSSHCSEMNVDVFILKKIAEMALHRKCSRLQFYINKTDNLSREKYQKLGGTPLQEWLTVRLSKTPLTAFANEPNQMTGQFLIRPAMKEDVESILYMIQCLAEYEKEPFGVKIDKNILLEDGFGSIPYYRCFIAESHDDSLVIETNSDLKSDKMPHNPKIVGIALYYVIYCKRKGKVLHLEDLYVKERFRNRGLGTALMKECAKVGLAEGCNEMNWQVLDWNQNAIDLYEKIGGKIMYDLELIRITRDNMLALIQK